MATAGGKISGQANQRSVYKDSGNGKKKAPSRTDSTVRQVKEVAQESSENWEAVLQSGSVLADGLQDISREWMSFARITIEVNIEGWNALLRSRNVQEFVSAQNSLVRRNVEALLNESARMGELSIDVVNTAVQRIGERTAEGESTTDRAA